MVKQTLPIWIDKWGKHKHTQYYTNYKDKKLNWHTSQLVRLVEGSAGTPGI